MKPRNQWMRPGWPWELEILSFVFVLVSIVVPLYAAYLSEPAPTPTLLQQALGTTTRAHATHFIHGHDTVSTGRLMTCCPPFTGSVGMNGSNQRPQMPIKAIARRQRGNTAGTSMEATPKIKAQSVALKARAVKKAFMTA